MRAEKGSEQFWKEKFSSIADHTLTKKITWKRLHKRRGLLNVINFKLNFMFFPALQIESLYLFSLSSNFHECKIIQMADLAKKSDFDNDLTSV